MLSAIKITSLELRQLRKQLFTYNFFKVPTDFGEATIPCCWLVEAAQRTEGCRPSMTPQPSHLFSIDPSLLSRRWSLKQKKRKLACKGTTNRCLLSFALQRKKREFLMRYVQCKYGIFRPFFVHRMLWSKHFKHQIYIVSL